MRASTIEGARFEPFVLRRSSRLFAWAFLVLQFANLGRQALIRNFGAEWNILGYGGNVASIVVFLSFLWSIRNLDGRGALGWFPTLGVIWWWASACLVSAGIALGWAVHHYAINYVALDAVPYVFFLGMVVVGSKPAAFHYVVKLMLALLFVAIALNVYALMDIRELASHAAAGDRFGVDSLAYETQATLGAWPLLLLLSNSLKKWRAIAVFAAVLLYAGMMVLFQKRLGSAVVLLVVALYVFQSLHARVYQIGGSVTAGRHYLREFGMTVIVGLALVFLFGRGIFLEQAHALFARIAAQGNAEYSQGAFSVFTSENERFQVVYECFSSFDWHEWLIGRGMGGAFEWISTGAGFLPADRADVVMSKYFLPDLGYFGRREFEIGLLMPLLKGGLVFFLTFFSGVFWILVHPGEIRKDFYSSAAYFTILYEVIFLLHGGGFILSDSLTLIVWGLSVGRCLHAMASVRARILPSYRWAGAPR